MAYRTDSGAVVGILGDDYGPMADGTLPDVTPFIATANVVITRANTCATQKGYTITDEELELMERWMAAHFYAQSDKTLSSKSTEGASASFSGSTDKGFDSTLYGQTAMRIDPSNCLFTTDKTWMAGGFWLGKPPSSQRPYTTRD
jgi:hypothetical protein